MNYSLGNMLSRGGALNPNGLSLDLAFAADKTLTARRGPTPTFTRASTATFVGSDGLIQSAAINDARFDHDPVTLACKGLLIEESRSNSVLNSDLYLTSTPTNITATTITGTSVTGSSQIRELSLTSSGVATGVQANLTGTGTGTKTISVFIKKPTSNAAPYFTIGFASSAIQYAGIQLTMSGASPVVSVTSTPATGFSVVSSSIEEFPNGWYRVSVVASGVPSTCFLTLYPSNAVWNGTSDIRQTLVAAGTNLIYIFGAQVELGSFQTSYIPTTTAALTRSADVCSITGGDFTGFWNQSEGTLFASGITQGYLAMASSGANANQIAIFRNPSPLYMRFDVAVGGSYGAQIIGPTITGASFNKIAGSYALNDVRAAFNGALGTQDTTVTIPSNLTTLNIGSQSLGVAPHNGHVARIQYFRKLLPNAKLQSLTT